VRSREDRGIVAVLDKRLLTKKYGQTFLNSLPPTLVRTGPVKQLPGLAKWFLAVGNGGMNSYSLRLTPAPVASSTQSSTRRRIS
jgi:DNA polymerase-3 subunit epsilon/ATP-dependent DNA helicase DinG